MDPKASGSKDWRASVEKSVKSAELESFLFSGVGEAEGKFGEEVPKLQGSDVDSSEEDEAAALSILDPEGVEDPRESRGRKAAWEDEDDLELLIDTNASRHGRAIKKHRDGKALTGKEYLKRLRAHHEKIHPQISWAELKSKKPKFQHRHEDSSSDEERDRTDHAQGDAEDIVDELLLSAAPLLGRNKSLQKNKIDVSPLPDANKNGRTAGFVNSVQFQSAGQLMLTCGKDRRLHLFNIDGVENHSVHSVYFEDMKVWKAAFSPFDDQVVLSGTGKKYFYFFDVENGKLQRISSSQVDNSPFLSVFTISASTEMPLMAFHGQGGDMPLFSVKSREWVGSLKMNSGATVESAAFSHDGLQLYSAGSGGMIHVWDLRMRRCLNKFVDEGALRCTSMAIDQGGKYLAAGSEMGVVNVYDFEECHPHKKMQPKPIRALTNLTTTIDLLEFNRDSQILAMGSQRIPGALRLVHLPSCTVFQNWPTKNTPLGHVSCAAFSPGGGFLAVGNSKGKVPLYRMHHYSSA